MKTKVSILFALMVASAAVARWAELPLEKVVRQSHVVVIGEITNITVAPPPEEIDQYQFDVADITVQEVLLNTLTNQVIKPKQELPLSMPSIRNNVQISTDIRYKIGSKGIWILEFRDKTFWATYPKDFQPMSAEKEVRAITRKLNEEPSNQAIDSNKE